MTRIIGGEARGRRIQAPHGNATRPTSDRVREALFSSLESDLGTLRGRAFLDLYAGSGGVGLEARSRGAEVTLVERSPRAGSVIRANATSLGFDDVYIVIAPVGRVRDHPSSAGAFDIVFADPPYDYPAERLSADLRSIVARGWVSARAVVVVERDRRSPWHWPDGFTSVRERAYGETMLWYGLWAPAAAEEV